jgi:hypothetical protein
MIGIVLALFLQSASEPQEKPSVEGLVLNAVTGQPVKRAQVTLRIDGKQNPYTAQTDDGGRYVFAAVDPGVYVISAERMGFNRQDRGIRGVGGSGPPMLLNAGLHLRDINFKLKPHNVILGRVLDEQGDPVPYVNVDAMQVVYSRGSKRVSMLHSAQTNDLGQYRLFGVSPGRYIVSATHSPPQQIAKVQDKPPMIGYPPVYFPNTVDQGRAQLVDLTRGGETLTIDFTLTPTRTITIRGKVVNRSTGQQAPGTSVSLIPRDAAAGGANMTLTVSTDREGNFQFRGVLAGSYWLSGDQFGENERFSGRQSLEVPTTNLDDVVLSVGRGIDVSGRVRAAGEAKIDLSGTAVLLQLKDPNATGVVATAFGQVQADGSFVLKNVLPFEFYVELSGLGDKGYLKSVTSGRDELLETGLNMMTGVPQLLDLVVSADAGRIEGMVTDGGQPAARAQVIAVPIPSRRNRPQFYKVVSTSANGKYSMSGVSPGEYTVFAAIVAPGESVEDPEFIQKYERKAKSISIKEGSREVADLQLSDPESDK